jgi:hypothetical protein
MGWDRKGEKQLGCTGVGIRLKNLRARNLSKSARALPVSASPSPPLAAKAERWAVLCWAFCAVLCSTQCVLGARLDNISKAKIFAIFFAPSGCSTDIPFDNALQNMFHDLVHFTQLACTDYVAPGSEDYSKLDGNGNVFCGFDTFAATGKLRTAKDGEWADFTGTTTITVSRANMTANVTGPWCFLTGAILMFFVRYGDV